MSLTITKAKENISIKRKVFFAKGWHLVEELVSIGNSQLVKGLCGKVDLEMFKAYTSLPGSVSNITCNLGTLREHRANLETSMFPVHRLTLFPGHSPNLLIIIRLVDFLKS